MVKKYTNIEIIGACFMGTFYGIGGTIFFIKGNWNGIWWLIAGAITLFTTQRPHAVEDTKVDNKKQQSNANEIQDS